jgi:tetratricopeptide (TPR) repeat protein
MAHFRQNRCHEPYKLGDALCQGQNFTGNPIRVACINARKVLWINKAEDLNQCEQSYPSIRRCSLNAKTSCKRIRGELSVKPLLIRPYGEILAKPPSELQWIAIKDADYYEVHVLGDKTWKFTSTQAHLKIPSISSKSSIQVIIEAFYQSRLLSASTTTFNLLEPNQFQQIKADLSLVDRIQVSIDQKKKLKLAIYSNVGLLDDSISLVQEEAILHPGNPSNIRLLGDIYLEAGLLDEANDFYKQALEKASKVQNKVEINLAKWGLDQVIALTLEGK